MPSTPISNRLQQALLHHPGIVLTVFLAVTVVLGWQARNFEVDASAETLLTQDNEHYINTQLVNRQFSPDEFLLIAYRPLQHELFSQQTYDDIAAIGESVMELDRSKAVQSLLTVPLLSAQTGNINDAEDLSSFTLENQDFSNAELSEIFRDNPLFEDLLIDAEQTATAIQLTFVADPELTRLNNEIIDIQRNLLDGELSAEQEAELEQLQAEAEPLQKALTEQRNSEIAEIRQILTEYEGRAELYLGGTHVLGFQLIEIITNDLLLFGTAIGLMICIVLAVIFRYPRWVIIPVVCCGCSVLMTMGILALLGIKATVISANFIALQLILTLAIVVHLIVQYRETSRANPKCDAIDLVAKTLRAKVAPCLFAGLTTSVGFSSLLLSGIQPVISFGYMMILAMAVSIIVSLILFPSMMAMFDQESSEPKSVITTKLVKGLSSLSNNHPLMVGMGSLGFFAVLMLGLGNLNVENSFLNYFDDDTRVHRELTFIDQEFGGSTPLDIVFEYEKDASEVDLVLTAETVQLMQQIQERLRQREGVGKTLSLVNFTEVARAMNQDRPLTEYELSSVYYLMEDSLRESLVGSFLSTESGEVRISARIQDATPGLNRAQLITDLRNDVTELLPESANVRLTNLFVLYQDVLQKLFRSQILTLSLVFVVLLVTFAIIFRSIRISLLAIVPNICATLSILGVMGWLGIPLDLMTITIAAIAMGIAVDDTIHYVHRYLEELRGSDTQQAVTNTHSSVGYAIVYTSFIVIIGFSLLSFSDFVPSIYFGLLTGVAMFMALFSNLTLLPVMLAKWLPAKSQ